MLVHFDPLRPAQHLPLAGAAWSHSGWTLHLWDTHSHTKSRLSGLSLEVLLDQIQAHVAQPPVFFWMPPVATAAPDAQVAAGEAALRRAFAGMRAAVRRVSAPLQGFERAVEAHMQGGVAVGGETGVNVQDAGPWEWVDSTTGAMYST